MHLNLLQRVFHELIKHRTFIVYSIIGISGATIDYLAFIAMIKWIPLHYLIINSISTSLGVINNFLLNARFNFSVKDRLFRRFVLFYLVGLVGMAVATGMLYVMVDLMSFSPQISKLMVIFVIVVLQFNLNKRISFARRATEHHPLES
jgi:putative flippase GtrA